jgi:hypothetical protein
LPSEAAVIAAVRSETTSSIAACTVEAAMPEPGVKPISDAA